MVLVRVASPPAFPTHTAPSPAAISLGRPPGLNVFTISFVSGSMRETRPSPPFSAQTAPSPTATLPGTVLDLVSEATPPLAGSSAATPFPSGFAVAVSARSARRRPPRSTRRAGRARPARMARRRRTSAGGAKMGRGGRAEAERLARRLDQLGAALVALVALLGERLLEHRVELGVAAQRRRLLLHVRPHRLRLGLAAKRRRARQALVEHARERVDSRCARRPSRRGSAPAPGSRACPTTRPVSVEAPPSCLVMPKSVR